MTIFTVHAAARMKQRGISVQEVERCLEDPDRTVENEEAKAVRKLNDKLLVVVYKKLDREKLVITAYKTSKIKRYL